MKRLMTTLIFVLLGWTGFCLADGVTVSGTVTISGGGGAMPFDCLGTSNIFLLDNNGDIVYTGSITQNTSFETVYSIANVASGTYTLKFEGYGGNRVVIYEETSVEVGSEAKTADITLSNSDVKNGTHRAVQFVVVQEGGSTAIAGASVTGTPSTEGAKSISLISDKDGKVTFFFEQTATLSVTAKATAYEDKMLTFDETFSGTFLTENVQIAMKAAAVKSVTLSGAITMVPAGDFPADFQIQLTNIRHEYSQTTPVNNQYSFENVPVGEMSDGPSTLEVYDPTEVTGFTEEYTVTTPNRGMFLISNENATFTQDITITKAYARVKGTINNVATLGSTLPTITLTKEGQTSYSYSAQATEDGAFTIKRVSAGTYTVGTTLAGYAVKNAPKFTITENLADVTLSPLEFEEADVEITFKAMLSVGSGNDFNPFNGAVVKLFAKGADVATAEPLTETTADALGQFTLKTSGKLGTEYILYVTHEKIKPCTLEVTATKATMTGEDLNFEFELAPVAIPTPTFTPNRGNVKPGTTIAFTFPESLDIENDYNDMAFILYVENNATVELKSDVATIMTAITGGIDGGPAAEGDETGDETEPSATLPFKVGMYREGEWAIPVSLSADASGAVVLRAVLAVSEDMNTLLYSNEMTATYTVEGEAVKPTAPTFYVDGEAVEAAAAEIAADAVVTLQNGYEEDEAEARLNPIYYKLNGTDADFEISDATVLTAEGFDALTIYNAGSEIAIDEDMTIKAATAHINVSDMTVTWSDITTVAFTVTGGDTDPELPETVAKPTFSVAAGAVDKGTKLTWTWDEAYDEYPLVGVVYVANGKDEDLNITTDDFQGLYQELPQLEEGSVREDGKVYLYVGANEEEGSEEEGICMITKDMTVKARLAVLVFDPTDEEAGAKMALSPVATAAYTIKTGGTTEPEKDTVATPTFNPAAGEVAKGTKVTVACATDSVKIYYTVDGSEPTAASTEYTAAIEINEALTIKAIAIKGETKSAVASAAYTVKVANEELELAGVSVYPNPSDGEFQLDLPVATTVEVFASTGVLRQRVEAGAGVMTLNIDRSGIYFLRITADGRTTVKRVVVR